MTGHCEGAAESGHGRAAGPGRAEVVAHSEQPTPAPIERDGHCIPDARRSDAVAARRSIKGSKPTARTSGAHPHSDPADVDPHPTDAAPGGETTAIHKAKPVRLSPSSRLSDPANNGPRKSAKARAPDRAPQAKVSPPGTAGTKTPAAQLSPKGARAAIVAKPEKASWRTPRAKDDQGPLEAAGNGPRLCALIDDGEPAVHLQHDAQSVVDRRFSDPAIAEIVELWRMRQDIVRSQMTLTVRMKAICRRAVGGDLAEAARLWRSLNNGCGHPMAEVVLTAIGPLKLASQPLEASRAAMEKTLTKLGAALAFAPAATAIRGVNGKTLASIVGEVGDPGAYRSVSALWKRCGLAVIEGERQRKKAGDAALLHGYAPARHAVIWNVGQALLKAQGTGEAAGPYRLIYDARKAYERPRVDSDGHAHNRAMRYMTKRLLRDIYAMARAAG